MRNSSCKMATYLHRGWYVLLLSAALLLTVACENSISEDIYEDLPENLRPVTTAITEGKADIQGVFGTDDNAKKSEIKLVRGYNWKLSCGLKSADNKILQQI